jgi:phage I-like protein
MSRFISVKINKTPIPEVKMPELNVSQLVASNKLMEDLIETQNKQMEEMEAEILALKEEIKKHEESKKPKIDEMDELAEQFSKMTLDELKIDEMDELVENFSKMNLSEVKSDVVVVTTEDKTVQVDEDNNEKTSSSKCLPFQTCFYSSRFMLKT